VAIGANNDPNARSDLAFGLSIASLVPAVTKRGVDQTRILLARRHAVANDATKQWLFQMASGRPTTDVVPMTGGDFTMRKKVRSGWRLAFQASTVLGMLTLGSGLVRGVPNIIDGIARDDGSGIMTNRSGRTGVFGLTGAGVSAAVLGVALVGTVRDGGPSGVARLLSHRVHMHGAVAAAGIAVSLPFLANEMGFLDWLNRGETRSPVEVARDTTRDLLGLDDD
jgi:hypothetical protein